MVLRCAQVQSGGGRIRKRAVFHVIIGGGVERGLGHNH